MFLIVSRTHTDCSNNGEVFIEAPSPLAYASYAS